VERSKKGAIAMKTCPDCHQNYPDEIESCPHDGSRLAAEAREERECPYCAELILRKARVCKHCGHNLEPLGRAAIAVQTPPPATPERIVQTPSVQPQGSKPVAAASDPPAVSASLVSMSEAEKRWRAKSDADLLAAARQPSQYTEEGIGMIRAELRRRGLDEPRPIISKVESVMQNNAKGKSLPAAMFFAGGLLGVLLVRAFFLDRVEELGWRMFWSGIGNGEPMQMGAVLQSATFAKCACGFLLVGLCAALVTWFAAMFPSGRGNLSFESPHGSKG
jgi:hypothetical protein